MGPVVITGLGCFGVAVLAGSAGVGGGGLYVPLLMLTLQMEMGDAVVLSHVVVFGSVAAQVLVNLPRRHKTMPLIDYVAPVLLLPAQLSGSALGLCLRTLFPRAVLVCVCVVILTLLSRKMVSTAIAMHTVEKREKHVGGSGLHECLLTQPPGGPDAETADRLDCRGRLAQLPWASLVFLAAFLGTFLLCLLALGGDLKVPYVRRAQPCSAEYWAFTLLAVSLGALAALGAVPALQPATLAAAPAYAVSEDPVWLNGEPQLERAPSSPDGAHSVAILPAAAAAAGFVAGLLGLGGGELIGPLCVVLGMPTQVAAATTSFIIFFCELFNLVHFAVTDVLPESHFQAAVIFAACSFAGALAGRMLSILAMRSGRESLPVFILGLLLGLSAVLVLARALGTGALLSDGGGWSLGPLCVDSRETSEDW